MKIAILAVLSLIGVSAHCQQIDWNTQIKNRPSFLGGPTIGDHIQYVSPFGNDASDGLSWATAKLTCTGALLAIGSNTGRIIESPALGATCIAATGSATGLNGFIFAPQSLYMGPLAQATAGVTGVDSQRLRFSGSIWNGSKAIDDCWDVFVNSFSGAFSDGSNLIVTHCNVSNGAGRILFQSDIVVDAPRAATALLNSNSFAFDNQGHYFEGQSRFMLWEMANTASCDGCSLATTIFRQNFVPIFESTCAGCQAEFALGGSGTLSVSGNYSGPPKWLFTNLRGSSFNTVTFTHSATAPRTVKFVDADSNTVQPLAAPGDNKWVFYIDNLGVQQRTQPAFSAISGTATAAQVTAPGSLGQVVFNNTTLGADSNFFWDNTNKRLGIGQAVPLQPLHVKTSASGGFPQQEIENTAAGGANWFFGGTDNGNGAGGGKFLIHHTNASGGSEVTIDSATGNVGIGQTAPGSTLDVNGTANVATSVTSPKMCLSANVCWSSGAGVPAGATCTTAKGGSLYSRTDGTTTTSLYVCDNGTGVWTAK